MALRGFDIASVNGAGQYDRTVDGDFVLIKASQGATWPTSADDIALHTHWVTRARHDDKLVGRYHYAHPKNGAAADFVNFANRARPAPGDVLALDFEPLYSPYPADHDTSRWPAYVLTFAARTRLRWGCDPWLYLNHDHARRLLAACTPAEARAIRRLPLWFADYTAATPTHSYGWPVITCWQYSAADDLDRDRFFGDRSQWHALGVPSPRKEITMADAQDILDELARLQTQVHALPRAILEAHAHVNPDSGAAYLDGFTVERLLAYAVDNRVVIPRRVLAGTLAQHDNLAGELKAALDKLPNVYGNTDELAPKLAAELIRQLSQDPAPTT